MIWVALGVAGVLLAALLFLPVGGRFTKAAVAPRPATSDERGLLETVYFDSAGVRLEGWLFTPHRPTDGVVVMAPGLTSTKDSLLEPFAWNAVAAGYAVLLFDFRTLGGSDGMPRHHVDPHRQVEDYLAAIAFIAARFPRVVLWGTSFSGGEAIVAASRAPVPVAGVIAQVAYLAPAPHLVPKGVAMLRYAALVSLDLLRVGLSGGRLPAVYLPAFGQPGEFAFYTSRENPHRALAEVGDDGAHAFWRALPRPLRGGWRNVIAARMLASFDRYRPLEALAALRCPLLLIVAEHDDAILLSTAEAAAARLPAEQVELCALACEHFSVYLPPVLEANLAVQTRFLARLRTSSY